LARCTMFSTRELIKLRNIEINRDYRVLDGFLEM